MEYDAILAQILALLQQEQHLSYRFLKRRLAVVRSTRQHKCQMVIRA